VDRETGEYDAYPALAGRAREGGLQEPGHQGDPGPTRATKSPDIEVDEHIEELLPRQA